MLKGFLHRLPHSMRLLLEILSIAAGGLLLALFLNAFAFRFYKVIGPSMQPTLATNDIVLINKIGVTGANLIHTPFTPERGQLVVFRNPLFSEQPSEDFIIKRVIGLPGEHIVIQDTKVTIYNTQHSEGFNPDESSQHTLALPTAGTVDRTIPENEVFVIGDNRVGEYSHDSRNGLSTIRTQDIEGIATMRLFPFTRITLLQ
jgi:signal peptidase I